MNEKQISDLRNALENLHREAVKLYGTLGYQGQLDQHDLGPALQEAEHILRLTADATGWEGGYYPDDARVLGWYDARDHLGPNPFTKPALLKAYDEGYADYSAPPAPAPFALVWDGQMGSLRRRDGFTVIATMSERTYKRIKQAQDDGADFYALKAMFPKKHTVYNA